MMLRYAPHMNMHVACMVCMQASPANTALGKAKCLISRLPEGACS